MAAVAVVHVYVLLVLFSPAIVSSQQQRQQSNNVKNLRSSYDFIIVGSGSSGSVLANRLSEVPQWDVLLVEVGHRPSFINDIPIVAPALQFTDYTWKYQMEKTPGVCLGLQDQRCPWPRGRGLGGTTLINYMIYTRGHRADYDRWAAEGNPGWSYRDVLPYFMKSEDVNLRWQDVGYHGRGGPLSVEDVRFRTIFAEAFVEAGKSVGYPYVDYNGAAQHGFSYVQATTRKGVRHSAYSAFIAPVESRPNLHILTATRATKLLLLPGSAAVYGLELVRNRSYFRVNATKEVILCAGAFNSPQLLMLSGLGPEGHLAQLGIPVVRDLPGVGRNMHDHITFLGLLFNFDDSVGNVWPANPVTNLGPLIEWVKSGRGPFTSLGGVEALGYLKTNLSQVAEEIPDMELIMMSGRWDEITTEIVINVFGINAAIANLIRPALINKHFMFVLPMHLKPKSIGHLELKSKNPYHWPLLYGNHLSDAENHDVKAFVKAVRFMQKLIDTPAFRKFGTRQFNIQYPGCNFEFDSDDYWECAVRHVSTTLHHQVGTCRMGRDNMAVVDARLKVHGTKGLRVADTSVIPFALNAHTNAPAYMVGEKTADIVKEDWKVL